VVGLIVTLHCTISNCCIVDEAMQTSNMVEGMLLTGIHFDSTNIQYGCGYSGQKLTTDHRDKPRMQSSLEKEFQ